MQIVEDSSIGSGIRAYGRNVAFIFVDFRSKRACRSNIAEAHLLRALVEGSEN